MEVDVSYMFDVMNKNFRIFFVDNKRIANKVIFFDKKDAKKFCGGIKKYYFCNPISRGESFWRSKSFYREDRGHWYIETTKM